MSHFSVRYTYTDDRAAQDELRPTHRAYLAELAVKGDLIASGPLLDTEPAAALLIFEVDSAERVAELLDQDPFQLTGLVAERQIEQWNPVIGVFAQA